MGMTEQDARNWLQQTSKQSGASVEDSDVQNLMSKNDEDLPGYQSQLSDQYKSRGTNNTSNRPFDSQTDNPFGQQANANAGQGNANQPQTQSPWQTSAFSAFAPLTSALQQQNDLTKSMFDRQTQQDADAKAKSDGLYNTLLQRSNQSLNVDPNDPVIANQVNGFRAEQTLGARNAIDQAAEASGPLANLAGQRRLMNENAAQQTGQYKAGLMATQLQSKRDEIAQALASMGGMLSAEEQNTLTSQLGLLDNAIKQQGIGLQDKGLNIQNSLGQGGLQNDLLKTILQNQQFNANLGSQNDQFAATTGLNAEDRAKYWDYMNTHPQQVS